MKLVQHGGEGTGSYVGKSTNKGLRQLGGEGKSIGKGGEKTLLKPNHGPGLK